MLEIPEVELKVAVAAAAAKQGVLADSPFFNSISKSQLIAMEELRQKAEKYVLQEENINARWENEGKAKSTQGEQSNRGNKGQSREDKQRDLRRKHFPLYHEFTPLRKPLHEVYLVMEGSRILPPPP